MTIREVFKKYHKIEIELLLAHALKKPKEFLYLHPEYRMSENQKIGLLKMIERRQKGEPVAYILGYKDFMGNRFRVNRDVLIPRPETEWLVEKAVAGSKYHVASGKPIKVLDLGTGSGCIAVSIASQLKNFQFSIFNFKITASDISKKALKVARQNAKTLTPSPSPNGRGGRGEGGIKFIHSNILQNVGMSFDIIIANLPYVPKKYYVASIKHLGWEPKASLVDPVRDFNIYKMFLEQARSHINPGGVILMEIDPKSKTTLSAWTKRYLPASKIKFRKDFNGLWRYAEIFSIPKK